MRARQIIGCFIAATFLILVIEDIVNSTINKILGDMFWLGIGLLLAAWEKKKIHGKKGVRNA